MTEPSTRRCSSTWRRAGATITNFAASHALFLTKAGVVSDVISAAARNALVAAG